MRHVLEAVDRVRKREHKGLMSQGDTTLAKSKYLWLNSEEKCAAAMQSVPCYRLPLWASRMQLTFRILAIA